VASWDVRINGQSTRLPLLLALTGLAVGFGRKRDALASVNRSWRLPPHSPQRPREEIKYGLDGDIDVYAMYRIIRQGGIGSPVLHTETQRDDL